MMVIFLWGGNTRRDYGMLVRLAKKRPDYQFLVITNNSYKYVFEDKPDNINLYYNISGDDFYQKLAHCRMCFIPLTSDLQGGQIVLFGAALLRKPIVTTKSSAISSYFDESNSFLIPVGDDNLAECYIDKIINSSKAEIDSMTSSAYDSVKRYDADSTYYKIMTDLIKNEYV